MEFTEDQIRTFCAKDYQSVAARMTKSMLQHYDKLMFEYARLKQAYDTAKAQEQLLNPPPAKTEKENEKDNLCNTNWGSR